MTELAASFRASLKKYPTLHIETINVDEDHIHLQIEISPDVRVSDVVQRLKAVSSIYLKKKFKFIREMYIEGNIWSVGYFSSTIGLNEEQVRKYIERQGRKDFPKTQRSFEFS